MAHIFEALVAKYHSMLDATMGRPFLGLPGITRRRYDLTKLPNPELKDPAPRTKFPFILGVQYLVGDDPDVQIHLLKSPCSPAYGEKLTKKLVREGIHPLDIAVFKVKWPSANSKEYEFVRKNAVEMLWWHSKHQEELERELEENGT